MDSIEDDRTVADLTPGAMCIDDTMEMESLTTDLQSILYNVLDEKEIIVLTRQFGISGFTAYSLDDIAVELKLSTDRIRQISKKAIQKLKDSPYSNILVKYLAA